MGYVQQARAEQAVAALRQMSAAHENGNRDGVRQSIPAAELVPGDIILVEEGDTVPADARLIQSTALQTAEAALTGESLPVSKDIAPITGEAGLGDRRNMIFSGTAATYGRGRAVVTARDADPNGAHCRNAERRGGRTHAVADGARPYRSTARAHCDRDRRRDDRNHPLRRDMAGFSAIFDVLILGVALAVAAVPEGLPAMVTAVLSLGRTAHGERNASCAISLRSRRSARPMSSPRTRPAR